MMTHQQYEAALAVFDELIRKDPHPDTPEGSALLRIAIELELFEKAHFPIDPVTPEQLAKWRRDEGMPE